VTKWEYHFYYDIPIPVKLLPSFDFFIFYVSQTSLLILFLFQIIIKQCVSVTHLFLFNDYKE